MNVTSTAEEVQSCASCGASIYPEHLESGLAQNVSGRLLCKCCVESPANADPTAIDLPPLPIEASSRPVGQEIAPAPTFETAYSPPMTHKSAPGAAAHHVRTFHARLSEGAVNNMDAMVNEWLAAHPEVEIKFANTTVGVWEGKHAEPNLILMLFY